MKTWTTWPWRKKRNDIADARSLRLISIMAESIKKLRPRTHVPNNLVFWKIIPFRDANLLESGTFIAHVYGA